MKAYPARPISPTPLRPAPPSPTSIPKAPTTDRLIALVRSRQRGPGVPPPPNRGCASLPVVLRAPVRTSGWPGETTALDARRIGWRPSSTWWRRTERSNPPGSPSTWH
ncbi:MAG: hypothetical protein MZV65_38395 [Chromatiales bacterium]|nr:hypothetical protein [Chromatiales bacterium]